MFHKIIAASFLTVWFVLFGIESCEDVGFFKYDNPGMDRTVETTLASLGEAIKISDDIQVTKPHLLLVQHGDVYPSVSRAVSFKWVGKETGFLREGIPIYKLHCVFLI